MNQNYTYMQTNRRKKGKNKMTLYHRYTFSYIFLVLFTERACPQLAKANLGRPCLNKQITKIYRQLGNNKKNKKKKHFTNLTLNIKSTDTIYVSWKKTGKYYQDLTFFFII